ncbi:MAG: hypothetical protein SNJ75_16570, partial [Gemmataceae bacterium]
MLKKLLALFVAVGFIGLFVGCAEEPKKDTKDKKPATDKKEKDAKPTDKKDGDKKDSDKKNGEKKDAPAPADKDKKDGDKKD